MPCAHEALAPKDTFKVLYDPLRHTVEFTFSQWSEIAEAQVSDGVKPLNHGSYRLGIPIECLVYYGQEPGLRFLPGQVEDISFSCLCGMNWIKPVFDDPVSFILFIQEL